MKQFKSMLIYGFALFAMFFGSGNLVFPVKIGQMTGQYWFAGFLGLFITGIVLPFLGLFVVKLHKGSYIAFFAEAGKLAKVALPLFTLSLLGSFGVVPRCITVAYGGMSYMTTQISLELFSTLFCITVFFFCLKNQRMINAIGKWMSPVLLIALGILIITGITNSTTLTNTSDMMPQDAFYSGFITGYQTMDLFAAFFFSALIFSQIQRILPPQTTHRAAIKFAIKPSIIGATLLATVYMGFIFLGAHYADLIASTPPEFMLATIATQVMGPQATWFISIVMLFSCLTTAVALNNIYANYLCSLLKLKEDKFIVVLSITTLIAFLISLFNFKGIAAFLVPALEVSYPGIIALTLLSCVTRKLHAVKKSVFYGLLLLMIFIQAGWLLY
jgi:LIVCS family branched-chain amino acid:cation transporter